ncbi:MAG: metallopeptidase family protein [Chloroflexi bacterium]|nr:metallopeptidase family protein [Chloroflexota bacterium]
MHNIVIIVEDQPQASTDAYGDAGGTLGLYQGTPLGERGTGYNLTLPDKVTIYRLPLLEMCHRSRELQEEITLTLLHEIGHHVGLDDHELPF